MAIYLTIFLHFFRHMCTKVWWRSWRESLTTVRSPRKMMLCGLLLTESADRFVALFTNNQICCLFYVGLTVLSGNSMLFALCFVMCHVPSVGPSYFTFLMVATKCHEAYLFTQSILLSNRIKISLRRVSEVWETGCAYLGVQHKCTDWGRNWRTEIWEYVQLMPKDTNDNTVESIRYFWISSTTEFLYLLRCMFVFHSCKDLTWPFTIRT